MGIGFRVSRKEAIARGVARIVEAIRAKAPKAKVLLLGIFPRGEKASTPEGPNKPRDTVAQVNAIIAKLADHEHVFFPDIGPKFPEPDGSIRPETMMPDFVHPMSVGHQIWADAITPKLAELMQRGVGLGGRRAPLVPAFGAPALNGFHSSRRWDFGCKRQE